MMRSMRARRGFTLADLTICIALIAILASILFPVFARSREKARCATCMTNLVNIGLALRTYAADNDMLYPPRDNDLRPLWPVYWHSYLSGPVFSCPSMSHKGVKMGAKPGDYAQAEEGHRGGPPPPPPGGPMPPDAPPAPSPGPPADPRTELPGGGRIVFCQPPPPLGGPPPGPPPHMESAPQPEDPVADGATCYFYVSGYRYDQMIRRAPLSGDLMAWHNDRRNVLFTDGSMKLWTKGQYLDAGLDEYAWMSGRR